MSHEGKSSSKVLSDMRLKEDWEQRIIGPSMPLSLRLMDVLLAWRNQNQRNLKIEREGIELNMIQKCTSIQIERSK